MSVGGRRGVWFDAARVSGDGEVEHRDDDSLTRSSVNQPRRVSRTTSRLTGRQAGHVAGPAWHWDRSTRHAVLPAW